MLYVPVIIRSLRFYDLCDEMGFLVMDEALTNGNFPNASGLKDGMWVHRDSMDRMISLRNGVNAI